MKIKRIEVVFPFDVQFDAVDQQALNDILHRVCRRNRPEGQMMWPAGSGMKPLNQDMTEWDESTYFVDVYARDASPAELKRELETN